jgi:ABC-type transport system involved in multi-copper enzyme maturation permease subunit
MILIVEGFIIRASQYSLYQRFDRVRGIRHDLENCERRVPAEFILSQIRYRYQTLAEAFGTGWVDILLLFLFNILFLVAAFIKFKKYDVR